MNNITSIYSGYLQYGEWLTYFQVVNARDLIVRRYMPVREH
jgi:hypothetical protein